MDVHMGCETGQRLEWAKDSQCGGRGGHSRWANEKRPIPVTGQPHLPTPAMASLASPQESGAGEGTAPTPSPKPNCLSCCLNQPSRTFPVQFCSVLVSTFRKP